MLKERLTRNPRAYAEIQLFGFRIPGIVAASSGFQLSKFRILEVKIFVITSDVESSGK